MTITTPRAYSESTSSVEDLPWPTEGTIDISYGDTPVALAYNASSATIIATIIAAVEAKLGSDSVDVQYAKPDYVSEGWPHGYISVRFLKPKAGYVSVYSSGFDHGTMMNDYATGCRGCSTFCPNCFRGIPPACLVMTTLGAPTPIDSLGPYRLGLASFSQGNGCGFFTGAVESKKCCVSGAPFESVTANIAYEPVWGYYVDLSLTDMTGVGYESGTPLPLVVNVIPLGDNKPICTAINKTIGGIGGAARWTTGTNYAVGDVVTWPDDYHFYRCFHAHTSTGATMFDDHTDEQFNWWGVTRYSGWEGTSITIAADPQEENPVGGELVQTCSQLYFEEWRCWKCDDRHASRLCIVTIICEHWIVDPTWDPMSGDPIRYILDSTDAPIKACLWQTNGSRRVPIVVRLQLVHVQTEPRGRRSAFHH